MSTVLLALCITGLLGIVAGIRAAWSGAKRARDDPSSPFARRLRSAGWLGYALGVASWPLTSLMSYPYPDNAGRMGRIAGLPFPAAYFDWEGHDYVGTITFVACLANSVFWALLPRLVVVAHGIVEARSAAASGGAS